MYAQTKGNSRTRVESPRLPSRLRTESFLPSLNDERCFGFEYGRSSGYADGRSYVTSRPTMFRFR